MKIDENSNKTAFFDALYQRAKDAQRDIFDRLDTYTEQYEGSDRIDNSNERASAVRNITYELIESQVSSEIPAPCVSPRCYSEKKERRAKSIERLLVQVRDTLPFEEMNDIDERYTYILGGSVWFAEWDSSLVSNGETGGVRVHCINPKDFIPEPNIYNIKDMEYCFLRFHTTRADVRRKYSLDGSELEKLSAESDEAADEDKVTVIICFYRNDKNRVSQFIWSGDAVIADTDDYYVRKKRVCKSCGFEQGICTCGGKTELVEDEFEYPDSPIELGFGDIIPDFMPVYADGAMQIDGTGVLPMARLERTKLPYYTPNIFPVVIRKNTSKDGYLLGQSDCEFMRCQQQQINKVESRIMQKLMRAGITPIVPDDAEISLDNRIFGQVVKLKPNENRSMYGVIDTTPSIAQDIAEADRLYDQAKRIIGITDTFQGLSDANATSGVAKQLQIKQSAGRLESKKRMKQFAYSELDAIIFAYYLAYADEPREISYKDCFGRIHNMSFNRYEFLEYDEKNRRYYYDDAYMFSVDTNGTYEQQREYIWQKNLENLKSGTLGNPQSPQTLLRYWQCQERAHYPFARDNVEYFQGLVNESGEISDMLNSVSDTEPAFEGGEIL